MRALILTADYPGDVWSGIGTAVASQAGALTELGVEVHVLVPEEVRAVPGGEGTDGPVVHPLSRRRCPVRPSRFDLVHVHSLALSELAMEMRRRFALPVVYTAHSLLDLELEGIPGANTLRRLQAAVLRASDHIIFVSAADRAAAVARMPGLAGRSTVIPNGVAPPPRRSRKPALGGPIVFAGRFARSKGIALLGAIIRRLSRDSRLRFVLAGGHGDALGTRIVAELTAACQETCRVEGWLPREAMDELLSGAGLVVVPSRYEPFGMVALEAMRLGAPVLAAGVGGLPEVVGPDSGGRLIHSRDAAAWCAAILDIVDTPALQWELSRRGPAYVARHFHPRPLAERLCAQVYASLGVPTSSRSTGRAHAVIADTGVRRVAPWRSGIRLS